MPGTEIGPSRPSTIFILSTLSRILNLSLKLHVDDVTTPQYSQRLFYYSVFSSKGVFDAFSPHVLCLQFHKVCSHAYDSKMKQTNLCVFSTPNRTAHFLLFFFFSFLNIIYFIFAIDPYAGRGGGDF